MIFLTFNRGQVKELYLLNKDKLFDETFHQMKEGDYAVLSLLKESNSVDNRHYDFSLNSFPIHPRYHYYDSKCHYDNTGNIIKKRFSIADLALLNHYTIQSVLIVEQIDYMVNRFTNKGKVIWRYEEEVAKYSTNLFVFPYSIKKQIDKKLDDKSTEYRLLGAFFYTLSPTTAFVISKAHYERDEHQGFTVRIAKQIDSSDYHSIIKFDIYENGKFEGNDECSVSVFNSYLFSGTKKQQFCHYKDGMSPLQVYEENFIREEEGNV